MTGQEQNDLFTNYLGQMAKTRQSKNKDYANEVDSLANFRMAEGMGVPAWVGIAVRLGDKYARIVEQARKVIAGEMLTFAVLGEGFEDTCVDGANYFLLMAVAFEEWKRLTSQVLLEIPTEEPGDPNWQQKYADRAASWLNEKNPEKPC